MSSDDQCYELKYFANNIEELAEELFLSQLFYFLRLFYFFRTTLMIITDSNYPYSLFMMSKVCSNMRLSSLIDRLY